MSSGDVYGAVTELGAAVEAGFTRFGERFDQLERRFTRLDDRVSRLDDRVSRLDDRVSRLDDRVSDLHVEMKKGFGELGNRVTALESERQG